MKFQSIVAKISFAAFAVALAVALVASFGTRLGLWSYKLGIFAILPATAIGIVGLLAGLVWALTALVRNSGTGARFGIVGLLGAILTVGVPLNGLRLALTSPPIHDISTDIEYAPQFKALLALRKGAESDPGYDGPKMVKLPDGKATTVSALQKKYYGDVIPFAQFIKPTKLFWRALNLANAMGWHVVAFEPKEGRIEATDTTFWFGFTDDIVVRVRPAGKLGARLDVRSKSRVGQSDLGANAARIRAFLKRLKGM
jgi:uncharacterized protein (DUF1499 family)